MHITQSQKATVTSIETGLRSREIVCLWGNVPNGKTHVFHYLTGRHTIGLENKVRSSIRASHSENYCIEVLEGVQLSMRSERIEQDALKRQILECYGERHNTHGLDMRRRFTNLMLDLERARIMPTVCMDAIELLPRRGYETIKSVSQESHRGEAVGPAFLLSGQFSKRRMPDNFWLHIKEVKIGKVLAEEVAEFATVVAPGYGHLFTIKALDLLKNSPSTAEMRRLIRSSVEYHERHSHTEKIDVDLVRSVSESLTYSRNRIAA
jgi:hypothetical protein